MHPVAADTRIQVKKYLATQPDMDLVSLGRSSMEPNAGVIVRLVAYGPVDEALGSGLRRVIRESRGEQVPVKIYVFKGYKIEDDDLSEES